MKRVNQGVRKIDAMSLLAGKPVFTDDIAPENCLVVKLLRSPHAFARITAIDASAARQMPGVVIVLAYEDVAGERFTFAGQSYPEPSPYDRLILDPYVRYVGDPVAIVAAVDETCAQAALKKISVDYEVLDPVLTVDEACDHASVIHPEPDYHVNFDIGNDVSRNICSSGIFEHGDVDEQFNACDVTLDKVYHTKATSQSMMETFRAYTFMDHAGRLNIVSSTQVPFHVRRIAARALGVPKSSINVIKPRIGGGFGAKQTLVCELFPAIVTLKTGKPAKIVYDRGESFTGSNSRHEMKIRVKVGADRSGNILAIHMYTLSNTGAYGEHGPTTVGLSGHKTMSLYNQVKALKFEWRVVYTNTMAAGAFRGYGATQGTFALESAINELADGLNMDPLALRLKNLVKPGEIMKGYYGELLQSSALEACIQKGRQMIGWDEKFPCQKIDEDHIRAVGAAITMQGSGISNIDIASAQVRLQDDGFYTLMIGATDMGTGCDTVLAQMAAEILQCPMDRIIVSGVDTDHSPYDTGSYASSTTYLTGTAVVEACQDLIAKMVGQATKILKMNDGPVEFDGDVFHGPDRNINPDINPAPQISLSELARKLAVGRHKSLSGEATHSSRISPPPFMAGFAEIEVDIRTGEARVIDYVGVVDCGTPVNPNLARIQVEGGIVQGIGMALYEDIVYSPKGKMTQNSFMQYKIPTRLDAGNIRVAFESSFEPSGPFGAKSIGEVVINTPGPAIAHAIRNAGAGYHRTLPISAETILEGLQKQLSENVLK